MSSGKSDEASPAAEQSAEQGARIVCFPHYSEGSSPPLPQDSTAAASASRDPENGSIIAPAPAEGPGAEGPEPRQRLPPWSDVSLESLRTRLADFARERDWDKYHTPRNLLLALVGEAGELCELFQWRPDSAAGAGLPGFTDGERTAVEEELADVLLYLVRLADACGVDLGLAAGRKILKNAAKYPAERCRGSAAKYTAYDKPAPVQGQEPDAGQGQEEGVDQAEQLQASGA